MYKNRQMFCLVLILLNLSLLLPYLMTRNSVVSFTNPMRNEIKSTLYTGTLKPFYYTKKGSNESNNPLLTIATICDINSINSTLQIARNFYGPLSIAIIINTSINMQFSYYFSHLNNSYDISVGILYSNSLNISDKHIIDKLKHLSISQVNTEYMLYIDTNVSYISSRINSINKYDIQTLNMNTNINTSINNNTIWIIPSFQIQNINELGFRTIIFNHNQNMLIDIATFSKLLTSNLLICTNYYYITKTIYEKHKSLLTHCSHYSKFEFKRFEHMFIINNKNINKSICCPQLIGNDLCISENTNHIQLKKRKGKRRRRRRRKGNNVTSIEEGIDLKSIDKSLNILIVMALNCEYDMIKIVNSLEYNSNKMNIYWYFNVYNIQKCNNNITYDVILRNNNNIKIVTRHVRKMIFFIEYINPNNIIFSGVEFDYIWTIDDDLLLDLFNFNSFIKLSYSLNSSISQPA
eukprot:551551_1